MSLLSAIPSKRKILIEKSGKRKKSKSKKLCLIEFGEDKLIVCLTKSPKAKIQKHIINDAYQTGFKILWSTIEFTIIDNVGSTNANNFCRWINDSINYTKHKALARSITLTKLYDTEIPTGEKLVLTGCLIEKFEIEKGLLVSVSINNCSTAVKK